MKIKNVEKFRKDLYAAIEDGNCYNFCDTHTSAVVRKGHLEWVEKYGGVSDYNLHRDFGNGRYEVVALAYPIHFIGTGIYMTVDDKGVDFWVNAEEADETYFAHRSWIDYDYYDTKLGFVVAVINEINELLACEKEEA